jgi:hypothetical protein
MFFRNFIKIDLEIDNMYDNKTKRTTKKYNMSPSMIPIIQESQETIEEMIEEWGGFELPTLTDGFEATDSGFFSKKNGSYEIIHTPHAELIRFFEVNHNMNLWREHNDAYLIKKNDGSYVLKVIEHIQELNEWKLDNFMGISSEYKYVFEKLNVTVQHMYCVDSFVHKRITLEDPEMTNDDKQCFIFKNKVFEKYNIEILCNEDADYITKLDSWVNTI